MSANKKHCAYCHAILFEDDDVVYCPDCGASHHRDCWKKINICANADMHGKQPAEEAKERVDSNKCTRCGFDNSSNAVYCSQCGNQLSFDDSAQSFYSHPNSQFNPYGNLNSNDSIEGVDVSTLAIYIRNNSAKYITDFKKLEKNPIEKKKKLSSCIKWNWSAFIFGYAWLFYRKAHKSGWVTFFSNVVSVILRTPLVALMTKSIYDIIGFPTTQIEQAALYNNISANTPQILEQITNNLSTPMIIMFALSCLLLLGVHVVIGMFGEYIYKCDAIKKIKIIKEADTIENKHQLIAASGGTNIFMSSISIYLMSMISSYLINFMF